MNLSSSDDDLDELAELDSRPITLHKPADFEGMRKAGKLCAEVLDMMAEHVDVGVTTETLNT
ncbi:MAG: hypothetical protein FJX23_02290, partial [Alphaproteobacteria bacterium]|nr:hypothetical protein [Alphaproteobacteria bacterium]